MEREANYAAVGAFVLLVVAMAVLFVYWYSDTYDRRDYERYEIYFQGTVSGLERGAAVQYLGVDVGRVVTMRIDRRDPGRVQVIADIDSDTPISARTVAQLSLQGVTGLLYIDLKENTGERKTVTSVPSERYPVIPSVPSNFELFVSSLPDLAAQAARVLERVERLMSDRNIAALSSTVASLDRAAQALPGTAGNVDALVRDLRATAQEITATAASIRSISEGAAPELGATLEHVRRVADNLATSTARLDRFLIDAERDLGTFTAEGLPELERLLRDSRSAASEFRELARSLREDPSQLIYQPKYRGVEVPP